MNHLKLYTILIIGILCLSGFNELIFLLYLAAVVNYWIYKLLQPEYKAVSYGDIEHHRINNL